MRCFNHVIPGDICKFEPLFHEGNLQISQESFTVNISAKLRTSLNINNGDNVNEKPNYEFYLCCMTYHAYL